MRYWSFSSLIKFAWNDKRGCRAVGWLTKGSIQQAKQWQDSINFCFHANVIEFSSFKDLPLLLHEAITVKTLRRKFRPPLFARKVGCSSSREIPCFSPFYVFIEHPKAKQTAFLLQHSKVIRRRRAEASRIRACCEYLLTFYASPLSPLLVRFHFQWKHY